MKIIVLTSVRRGIASACLPVLCGNPHIEVGAVILAHGLYSSRSRKIKRRLSKLLRVGVLGMINGLRLRKLFRNRTAEDISKVCETYKVPFHETEFINGEDTKKLFRGCDADLGLSLGCSYIPKSVFGIPKCGMINIHTEVLPRFQGAYSIIWPICEGVSETGFTIHQIDSNIDTGAILYQEKYPITFFPKMKETIQRNLDHTRSRIPNAIAHVCENYDKLQANAVSQPKGKGYTTPSIWQYFRMLRNHRAMYKQTLRNGGHSDD